MIYKFIDHKGTFIVQNPQNYHGLYFPLTNKDGTLLSSISPNLGGDIKRDNDHFLTHPTTIEDLRNNLSCRRDFFIKTPGKIIRLSYPYLDTLEAGFLYHKIIKKTGFFEIEILNFIPYDLAAEVMWVKIKNRGKRDLKIIPTSFIPLYGRGEGNLRDHRHVSSLFNRIYLNKYGILLKPTLKFDERGHKINKSIYFVLGFENEGKPPLGQFPTLDYFSGKGSLISPSAIKNVPPIKTKRSEFDGKEACAAFRFGEKKLRKAEETNYFIVMGISEEEKKIKDIFGRLNSPQKIKSSLKETKKYWLNLLNQVEFDFGDKEFSNWLRWVKLQPVLRKLFGCSYLPHFDYGKGGRGFRDLWQDAYDIIYRQPEEAGRLIVNNFKGVRIDGSNATIITKNGRFISDRNKINRVWMDHGVWPFLTLKLYINRTGKTSILLKNIPYFRDHNLKRAREVDLNFSQKDFLLRTKNNKIYQGSILEHLLIQNLVQFFNVGKHNIIRLENADWNDGLDLACQQGESAAFSFMYAHNLREISHLLKKIKVKRIAILKETTLLLDRIYSTRRVNYADFKEKQKRLQQYLEKIKRIKGEKVEVGINDLIGDLEEKSKHLFRWLGKKEWLKLGFFNGYYDNKGRRIEGNFQGKIRMMLASSVFPIMSKGATEDQVKKTWLSLKKYLQDKKLGGFRLNTNFGSLCLDLGRAFSFSYGDKENGAFFNHMAIMLGYSLYERGFIKEGFEVMNSIYKMATNPKAEIYPMIPEYFNNEGKGLYLYLTGSGSWYIHTLIQQILGIKFIGGNILLEPNLLASNFIKPSIKIKFNFLKKRIKISFVRRNKKRTLLKIKEVFLGGKRILKAQTGYLIKKESLKKINKREISLRVCLE